MPPHNLNYNRMGHDGGERSGYEPLPLLWRVYWILFWLYDLCHAAAHSFCCLILNLPGGVGVGAEGEACIVVPQHTADSFDVYAVLEGCCGEGMLL